MARDREYEAQVRAYKHFIVKEGRAVGGWEFASDAKDELRAMKEESRLGDAKIVARSRLAQLGIDPKRPFAPPLKGPASGFGKEKTVADFKARIAWEKRAEATQRRMGHEAHAGGHAQARVAYERELEKKLRAGKHEGGGNPHMKKQKHSLVGARVQLHPGTDLWMRGAKYGEIVRESGGIFQIRMDHPGVKKLARFREDRFEVIESPHAWAERQARERASKHERGGNPSVSKSDREDFRGFCRNASDAQLPNIYEKERAAGRRTYATIAREEMHRRGIADDTIHLRASRHERGENPNVFGEDERELHVGDHVTVTKGRFKGDHGEVTHLSSGPRGDAVSVSLSNPVQAVMGPAILNPAHLYRGPSGITKGSRHERGENPRVAHGLKTRINRLLGKK
jgi:hypothetical protein